MTSDDTPGPAPAPDAPRRVAARVVAPPPRPVATPIARRAPPTPPPSFRPLAVVLAGFAAMMTTSFAAKLWELIEGNPWNYTQTRLLEENLAVELIDTAIVLVTLVAVGRPLARAKLWKRRWAVPCAAALFPVVIGLNVAYSRLLQALFRGPEAVEVMGVTLKDGWWAIGLVCLQPAVIEELFFRYLLLGHLRSHLGPHGAVWLSSLVFGMAHFGNIPGWPVLVLVGAGLGYARVLTGGLTLPIALHFLHNLAILGVEEVA